MKDLLLKLMFNSGVFAPFRLVHRSQSLILTYHRFSEDESPHKTSARTFTEHLHYLQKYYDVVPLTRITEAVKNGYSAPRLAAITIDDGHHDAYEVAYPILRNFGFPATLFVVTDFLDEKDWLWTDKVRFITAKTTSEEVNFVIKGRRIRMMLNGSESRLDAASRLNAQLKKMPDDVKESYIARIGSELKVRIPKIPPQEFSPINWEQARELEANGISIGSHTVTHPILTNVFESQLKFEINHSRARIHKMIGTEPDSFCYPNGSYNTKVKEAVARAGYRCAVNTKHGFNDNDSDVFALRRFHDEPDLEHFAQTTCGFELVKNQFRKALTVSN